MVHSASSSAFSPLPALSPMPPHVWAICKSPSSTRHDFVCTAPPAPPHHPAEPQPNSLPDHRGPAPSLRTGRAAPRLLRHPSSSSTLPCPQQLTCLPSPCCLIQAALDPVIPKAQIFGKTPSIFLNGINNSPTHISLKTLAQPRIQSQLNIML